MGPCHQMHSRIEGKVMGKSKKEKINEYEIVKEYSKLLCALWQKNKGKITSRTQSKYPELHWIYKHIREYRSSLKNVESNDFYSKFQSRIEEEFKKGLPGRYWNHTIKISIGNTIHFVNNKQRYSGEHKKANITLVLRPTYVKSVIGSLGTGVISSKYYIFDAKIIKINSEKLKIFSVQYANIFDDTKISSGYLSMTANKKFHRIQPTFRKAVKSGQSAIRRYVKETIKKSTV